jgi:hypothetical protein
MSPKTPVTQLGIDPGSVRLVALRLNHYATKGPHFIQCNEELSTLEYKIYQKYTIFEPMNTRV